MERLSAVWVENVVLSCLLDPQGELEIVTTLDDNNYPKKTRDDTEKGSTCDRRSR